MPRAQRIEPLAAIDRFDVRGRHRRIETLLRFRRDIAPQLGVREVQHDRGRRLVERARARAVGAHLDAIEPADAVLAGDRLQALDQLRERIVTPLMPTAAPRSNSISTCAGLTGASSSRRVILNSDSSGSGASHRRRGGRWCGPTGCRRRDRPACALGRAARRSRPPRAHAISFSVGIERRERLRQRGGDRGRSRRAPRASRSRSRRSATSVFAISGRRQRGRHRIPAHPTARRP